ncbi:MAG: ferrochelatase [Rhodanobacteraceae bacterium]
MTRYFGLPDGHRTERRRIGVVLVNLGTPSGPDVAAVRRYLAEFLADPRVVELPRWIWWPILHGVILRLRPRRSAHAYAEVWMPEGSPLLVHTRALADAIQTSLDSERPDRIVVRYAMRYGKPQLRSVLRELAGEGMRRLLVLPLYPQYSATTTGSVLDALAAEFRSWRWIPEFRFVNGYHDDPGHLEALARSVEAHWREHGRAPRILLSFHGLPQRYTRKGDPYFDQCRVTAQALRERLALPADAMQMAFQSRVGRGRWLSPYTDEVLAALPGAGVAWVQVLCPGFAVDCLETLEEIAIRYREVFLAAGGERFEYVPALNTSTDQVRALTRLILRHGQGWPEFDS